MKATDPLSGFVREAVARGQNSESIRQTLIAAGWPESEARQALDGWALVPDMPPVPRPRPYVSAREALVFGLLFLSLAVVCWHICALGFNLIERVLPDADLSPHRTTGAVRWGTAALLTFVPLFLWLDRRVRRIDGRIEGRRHGDGPVRDRSLVRRWLASVTLFAAALVLLIDLAITIYTLLSGELTLRFALKAVLVALTALLIFAYYRDEMDA